MDRTKATTIRSTTSDHVITIAEAHARQINHSTWWYCAEGDRALHIDHRHDAPTAGRLVPVTLCDHVMVSADAGGFYFRYDDDSSRRWGPVDVRVIRSRMVRVER